MVTKIKFMVYKIVLVQNAIADQLKPSKRLKGTNSVWIDASVAAVIVLMPFGKSLHVLDTILYPSHFVIKVL